MNWQAGAFGLPLKKLSSGRLFFGGLLYRLGNNNFLGLYFNSQFALSLMFYGVMEFLASAPLLVTALTARLFLIIFAGRSATTPEKQKPLNFFESLYRNIKISK